MLNIIFLYLGNFIRRTVISIYSRHLNTLASGGNIIVLNVIFLYLGTLIRRAANSIYSRHLSTSLESSLTCRTTPTLGVSQWWQYISKIIVYEGLASGDNINIYIYILNISLYKGLAIGDNL